MASQLPVTSNSSRLIGLDLLRFAAVVMVLGRHMERPTHELTQPIKALFGVWQGYGGFGVDLFFVLSGFLVSGLLFAEHKKHKRISISRFYLRRAWKIYPAFYLLIGATYFYSLFVLGYRLRDRPVFSELLFIQCYQQGHWNHTWTLAVEEHFYLALPILLLWLTKRYRGAQDPFRAVIYFVAATSVGCLAARVINYCSREDMTFLTHAFPTHLRIDSLFFGVAIAYAYHFHADWFRNTFAPRRYGMIGLGCALVAVAAYFTTADGAFIYTWGFTQLYLGFAAVLIGVLCCEVPHNRLTGTLATVGTFSYSIYLWHMATIYYAVPQLKAAGYSWHVRVLIYFVSAFVIGISMAKLVELPTLQLRDRFFPSRAAPVESDGEDTSNSADAARIAA